MLKYVIFCLSLLLGANATFYVEEDERVCGCDFKTYFNRKELECISNCTNNPYLVVAGNGSCHEPCVCTTEYNPVCGNDGKTYGNICSFNCAQKRDSRLAIITHCACNKCMESVSKNFAPVCGSDGITYFNKFIFNCAKIDNSSLCHESVGVCPCICTKVNNPVCGSDGVTYGNICELNCAKKSNYKLRVLYEGTCIKRCTCTFEYAPVCGTDGNTYTNKCMLECTKKNSNPELAVKCPGPCIPHH